MKKLLFFWLFTPFFLQGQQSFTETFNQLNISSDATKVNGSFTGDNSNVWTYTNSRDGQNYGVDGKSIIMRGQDNSKLTTTLNDGLSYLSFQLTNAFNVQKNTNAVLSVYVKPSGSSEFIFLGTSEPVGNATSSAPITYVLSNPNINYDGILELKLQAKNNPVCVDNIVWKSYNPYCMAETFDNLTIGSSISNNGSFTGDNNIVWNYYNSRDAQTFAADGRGLMMRGQDNARLIGQVSTNGLDSFCFDFTQAFTDESNTVSYFDVYAKENGGAYVRIGKTEAVGNTSIDGKKTFCVDSLGLSGNVTIKVQARLKPVCIDNIKINCDALTTIEDTIKIASYMPAKVNPKYPFSQRQTTKLNGIWKFKEDNMMVGQSEAWYTPGQEVFDTDYTVPGALQASGIFQDRFYDVIRWKLMTTQVKNFKNSWVKKSFTTPAYSNDERVWLKFGGIFPGAKIYLNGVFIDYHKYPNIAVKYDVTEVLLESGDNELILEFEEDFVSRGSGGHMNKNTYWTGLFRDVELEVTHKASIQNIRIRTDISNGNVNLESDVLLQNPDFQGAIHVIFTNLQTQQATTFTNTVSFVTGENTLSNDFTLSNIDLWTPETPNLYACEVQILDANNNILDSRKEDFGFRSFRSDKKNGIMYLNEKYLYLRGCGTLNTYPETVSQPVDREVYRNEIQKMKAFGFNHVRHHSLVPYDEYLEVANEEGILVQVGAVVHGQWSGQHDNYYIPNAYRKTKWRNLLKRTMNNPSLFTYCMGNEHGVSGGVTNELRQISDSTNIEQFVIVTAHHETNWTNARSDVAETNGSYQKIPWYRHEYSHSSSYPDISNKGRYTGFSSTGTMWYFDSAINAATSNGTLDRMADWEEYSKYYQRMNQKSSIEFFRQKKKNADGYSFWMGMDSEYFMGVIDNFGDEKLPASTFIQYNDYYGLLNANDVETTNKGDNDMFGSDEVNLRMRVLQSNGILNTTLVLQNSHYDAVTSGNGTWTLQNVTDGDTVSQGSFSGITCNAGAYANLATVSVNLPNYSTTKRLLLSVTFTNNGKIVTNDWYYMVYPVTQTVTASMYFDASVDTITKTEITTNFPNITEIQDFNSLPANGIVLSSELNTNTQDALNSGKNVLLLSHGDFKGFLKNLEISTGRIPKKWATFLLGSNYVSNNQVYGNIVRKTDVLGNDFPYVIPTKPYIDNVTVNPFWWAHIVELSNFPENSVDNLVEAIPYYKKSDKLSYVFQSKITGDNVAKLLSCNFRLELTDLDSRDVFARILAYTVSSNFSPQNGMTLTDLVNTLPITQSSKEIKTSSALVKNLELENKNTSLTKVFPTYLEPGDYFTIKTDFVNQNFGNVIEISVYSINGMIVDYWTEKQNASGIEVTRNAPKNSGIYFVKVKKGNSVKVSKILVR